MRSYFLCLLFILGLSPLDAQELAFPGAQGWASGTPGGRGGKIIRVTNLNNEGANSLAEAINSKGKRIVVFEVGGVIDLKGRILKITEPFLTIAGQTAPSPGITLIDGGISSDSTIENMRKDGRLKSYYRGRNVRLRRQQVEEAKEWWSVVKGKI